MVASVIARYIRPMTNGSQYREVDDAPAEKARRRRVLLMAVILLLGLPLYLIVASTIIGYLTAPTPGVDGGSPEKPLHWLMELAIYIVLGVVWALPLKGLVRGVGRKAG